MGLLVTALREESHFSQWSLVQSFDHTRLRFHQFCLTLLSERGESNKTNANKVSYKALYEAPLTRKTRLKLQSTFHAVLYQLLRTHRIILRFLWNLKTESLSDLVLFSFESDIQLCTWGPLMQNWQRKKK